MAKQWWQWNCRTKGWLKRLYQVLEVVSANPKALAKMDDKKFTKQWAQWNEKLLTEAQMKMFHWVAGNHTKIEVIVHDFSMSENHIGGDDLVSIVQDVLKFERKGFKIYTWYGSSTEALIVGIKK